MMGNVCKMMTNIKVQVVVYFTDQVSEHLWLHRIYRHDTNEFKPRQQMRAC